MTLGPRAELIIGSRGTNVYRLKKPYRIPEIVVSLPGWNHSVIYRDGKLFVAETAGLYVASYSGPETSLDSSDFTLYVKLPLETGGHWSRTVIVGPDNRLYIGIGISGNCSDENLDESYPFERRRGGVFVVDETVVPSQPAPYASGLRNLIGIAFDPETNVIYASNAWSDKLGYDLPPEVFSALSEGSFHGVFGDAHKIITFYPFISSNCMALAIFSPRFTEMLTDGSMAARRQAFSIVRWY